MSVHWAFPSIFIGLIWVDLGKKFGAIKLNVGNSGTIEVINKD